ncbi:hypothetical protein AtNW77_Chr2g0236711 [Arabidopsis thaliana]
MQGNKKQKFRLIASFPPKSIGHACFLIASKIYHLLDFGGNEAIKRNFCFLFPSMFLVREDGVNLSVSTSSVTCEWSTHLLLSCHLFGGSLIPRSRHS